MNEEIDVCGKLFSMSVEAEEASRRVGRLYEAVVRLDEDSKKLKWLCANAVEDGDSWIIKVPKDIGKYHHSTIHGAIIALIHKE